MATSTDKATDPRTRRYDVKTRLLNAMSEKADCCPTQGKRSCAATGNVCISAR